MLHYNVRSNKYLISHTFIRFESFGTRQRNTIHISQVAISSFVIVIGRPATKTQNVFRNKILALQRFAFQFFRRKSFRVMKCISCLRNETTTDS